MRAHPTIDALDLPRQRIVLALVLAGYDASGLAVDLTDHGAEEDFELALERPDGNELVVAYRAETRRFEIDEILPAELTSGRLEPALILNATVTGHARIALWPQSGCLVVQASLSDEHASVAELADELTDVAMLAHALRQVTQTAADDAADLAAQTPAAALSQYMRG